MKYSIGIDIGGTNTDAVLIDAHNTILASCKIPTTTDICDGFIVALTTLLQETKIQIQDIAEILIGTTHATNALLQQKELSRVGVLRIAGHNPLLPPCYEWPPNLRAAIYAGLVTVSGGFECQGTPITPFLEQEVQDAAHKLLELGAQGIAIVGTFSPLNTTQERTARDIVRTVVGSEVAVSVSSDLGGIGFIERENLTILNAALQRYIQQSFSSFTKALHEGGFQGRLYITQNNGTVASLEEICEYPVTTIASGPTNSFIGGARLAGLTDCIVIDIGGTSTDVGMVVNAFARRTIRNSCIAGITLNLTTPDVISIALGGGSFVTQEKSRWSIGPQSAGKLVLQESYAFGGHQLTVTDVALACRAWHIAGADLARIPLAGDQASLVMHDIQTILAHQAQRIAGPQTAPIVLVGGGAQLINRDELARSFDVRVPPYAHVANAYGAALAEISGTVDTVVSLRQREAMLEQLRDQARQIAIGKGAYPQTVRSINQQIIPFHYMPNNLARVIITVAGKRQ